MPHTLNKVFQRCQEVLVSFVIWFQWQYQLHHLNSPTIVQQPKMATTTNSIKLWIFSWVFCNHHKIIKNNQTVHVKEQKL